MIIFWYNPTPITKCATILFHEGSPHSEGLGAKWREVKIGLHLTLRLGWLLSSRQRNARGGNVFFN